MRDLYRRSVNLQQLQRCPKFSVTVRALFTRAVVLSCAVASSAPSVARPNVILIVTDDQGWGDLSCHGNEVIETPHIDSMADRGIELSRFYVSPVCSPTRASLMTGRHSHRTRVTDTYRGHSMMDPDEVTVAEALRAAGYATGIFGKWHLGDCYPMRPQDQGFDEAVVLRGGGIGQPSDPPGNNQRYTNPILFRNGEQFQAEGYCTDVYFDEAMRFIDRSVERQQPFFAYIATNAPHGPYHDVPPDLYQKYRNKDLTSVLLGNQGSADTVARVFAMVENIDQNVGRIFAHLDRLNLSQDTLVIFMSDNGPNTGRYVGPSRGMKSQVWEGGILSPFFACWPGKIAPGTQDDRIAAHIDILPTLLAAAEVDAPTGVKIDGRNLMPLLTDNEIDWADRHLFLQAHRGGQPDFGHHVAVVGQRWKLVCPSGFNRTDRPADAEFQLYDLQADPREVRNRIADFPQIATELRELHQSWFEDVSSERPDNYASPRIVIGTDEEPTTVLTWQDWQARGAGWGEQGTWLVDVPQLTTFDITVVLESPAAGNARLSIAQTVREQTIENPSKKVMFKDIAVPAGASSIQFALEQAEGALRPYQITLKRVPNGE